MPEDNLYNNFHWLGLKMIIIINNFIKLYNFRNKT